MDNVFDKSSISSSVVNSDHPTKDIRKKMSSFAIQFKLNFGHLIIYLLENFWYSNCLFEKSILKNITAHTVI